MSATEPMRVAVAACGAHWEAAALAEIEQDARMLLVRRCVDVADLLATAGTHRLDLALVAVGSPGLDAGVVERLVELGVRCAAVDGDGAALGIDHEARLGDLAAAGSVPVAPRERDADPGTLVAVWGATGAPGRSSLAVSLAAASAAGGRRTALVDADVYGGSIGQLLGVLDDVSGVMAACREVTRGRAASADAHLLSLGPHWDVLTGLPRSDMWHHLRPDALETVLRALRRDHDLVVVDCGFGVEAAMGQGPSRDQVTRRVLDLADEVLAVGRVDPVGLARLVRALDDAGPWRRPPRLVLNGFRASLGWTEREVAQTLRELTGHTPWAFLPQDGPGHDLALMTGRPLREVVPTSGYVTRVERLATELVTTR
ncbi:AAA family ATPase [Aeromicrobium choanae]|uniref:MinD-like ATPase involved in chromosome partitioning or flagellar assembly n=1 Tax=Aeromicrobium choanae TaxID=1736691 RepID=A0A1T4YR93_9ACTN|nr:P-loop NTPase [Aeromicrobium choanae]SKB04357.1 MinD-like ATPase involved in chromosome partitioning or flagellar assembly [Aeromicrobium choanae]